MTNQTQAYSFIPYPSPVAPPGTDVTASPRKSICFNEDWLPFVLGCLKTLARPETWKGTAAEVLAATNDAFVLLDSVEDCVSDLVFEQDGCLLKISRDGGATFETVYDGVLCIQAKIADETIHLEPEFGPESIQPIHECVTYKSRFLMGMWTLPVTVNEGNTLRIFDNFGIWSDTFGINDRAFCTDGAITGVLPFPQCGTEFEAGHPTDPLPSAHHMKMLALINGVYYEAFDTTITVPAGVHNARVEFLGNGPSPHYYSGFVGFDVEVCTATIFNQWVAKFGLADPVTFQQMNLEGAPVTIQSTVPNGANSQGHPEAQIAIYMASSGDPNVGSPTIRCRKIVSLSISGQTGVFDGAPPGSNDEFRTCTGGVPDGGIVFGEPMSTTACGWLLKFRSQTQFSITIKVTAVNC